MKGAGGTQYSLISPKINIYTFTIWMPHTKPTITHQGSVGGCKKFKNLKNNQKTLRTDLN